MPGIEILAPDLTDTITTDVCDLFYKNKKKIPKKVIKNIESELKNIEKKTKKKFGDLKNPLLVSVRSGARISMPGMMDTILNLGLNDKTVEGFLVKATPVEQSSPMLPNTIAWTFTAVPQ